ncbi:unnamed protein product [Linum trigynum]|uniref:60S ribosomal protein L18a-like protein n=1 Tax=Linum trigynum TaxID=586398 RepID=A0AAV2DK26_9ROSI
MDHESQKSGSGRSEPSAPPYDPQTSPPPVNPHGSTTQRRQQYYSTQEQHTTTNVHIEITNPPAVTTAEAPPPVIAGHTTTAVIIVERWTCCGMGYGWFLFVIGWIVCGIPWFVGFFILVFGRYERRERAGLLACATFAVVVSVVAILQAIKGEH